MIKFTDKQVLNFITNIKFPVHKNINDCWVWNKWKNKYGYGVINTTVEGIKGRVSTAYIFSYLLFKGKVPIGLQIDHLCRNRLCVNPFHLEAVTQKQNRKTGGCEMSHCNCVCCDHEASKKINHDMANWVNNYRRENQRLREALGVYADENNWNRGEDGDGDLLCFMPENIDTYKGWEIAKKVLEDVGK